MKQIIISFLIIGYALSCLSQDQAKRFEYKHMTGTLGTYELTIDLHISGNEVSGNALTRGKSGPDTLSGWRLQGIIDDYGIADIEAYRSNELSGTFSGLLKEDYKGTFRPNGSQMLRSFMLEEDYEASIAFEGYSILKDSALIDSAGSPHSTIDISLLLPDETESYSYIRNAILDAFFRMDTLRSLPDDAILPLFADESFRKYIESNIDIYDGGFSFNWELSSTSTIRVNREGLLVYRADQYGYTGGAHGMGISRFLVFDTDKMKQLKLEDIFIEGFESELSSLLENEYRAIYFIGGDEALSENGLWEDHIYPSENFFLTTDGMSFFYNPYELAPYSMGSITISLHRSKIQQLLREDAAVKRLGW